MHLNRPLSSLYCRAVAGDPTKDAAASLLRTTDAVAVDQVADAMAANAEEILSRLEALLAKNTHAHLAVLDERWAVPLVQGRRWREHVRTSSAPSTASRTPVGATIRVRWFSPEAHVLLNRNAPMVVNDTVADPRFARRAQPAHATFSNSMGSNSAPSSALEELYGVGFFAAHPILAPSGLPVAVVVVSAPSSDGLKPWTSEQANVLSVVATQLAGLLEHASAYALGLRKRHMVEVYNALQVDVKRLGLTVEGAGLIGLSRAQGSRFGLSSVYGNGLAQGLDEEVGAVLEKEQLFAAFQERMQERIRSGRSQPVPDDVLDVPHQLLPQLGQMITATAARALDADLVYLARKPLCARHVGASLPTERWTVVAQSQSGAAAAGANHGRDGADALAADVFDPDQLSRLPLAPAAHNIHGHHGLPALFYNVSRHILLDLDREKNHDDTEPSSPSLPWQCPLPARAPLFRAGAMISAGNLHLLPAKSDSLGPLSPPGAWGREEHSVLLLVILFSDHTRLLSPAEQGFVAALAAGSITWLRQASALDAHIRAMQIESHSHAATVAGVPVSSSHPFSVVSSRGGASRIGRPANTRRRPGLAGSHAATAVTPTADEYFLRPPQHSASRALSTDANTRSNPKQAGLDMSNR